MDVCVVLTGPKQPFLIFTWGNPSRGDDAIGPGIHDYFVNHPLVDTDLLTDFQLQIEHAEDLVDRQAVIFVDASVACEPPYEFTRIEPERDVSYTTHAMSPQSVLSVYQQIHQQTPPSAYLLSVRGTDFELGLPLSDSARDNMQQAITFLKMIIDEHPDNWLSISSS